MYYCGLYHLFILQKLESYNAGYLLYFSTFSLDVTNSQSQRSIKWKESTLSSWNIQKLKLFWSHDRFQAAKKSHKPKHSKGKTMWHGEKRKWSAVESWMNLKYDYCRKNQSVKFFNDNDQPGFCYQQHCQMRSLKLQLSYNTTNQFDMQSIT